MDHELLRCHRGDISRETVALGFQEKTEQGRVPQTNKRFAKGMLIGQNNLLRLTNK